MPILKVFSDLSDLSHSAADLFVQVGQEAISLRGCFLAALSGGGTPLALFRLLAQAPYCLALPWDKVHFFWGDERCVAASDPGSNYAQAYAAWLSHILIPEENIHRVQGELEPALAAAEYAWQLKRFAREGLDWPRLDFALMGLGADGHTASLFPGSPVEAEAAVIPVTAHYQDRPARRISLTPQVFNAARNVVFLAVGPEKAEAVAATLSGPFDPLMYPAQRIRPGEGATWWLVDRAAASLLPEDAHDKSPDLPGARDIGE